MAKTPNRLQTRRRCRRRRQRGRRHHVIAETNAALNDIGYSMPGQNWTYWNKGPGPGEEESLTTEERDWSIATGKACASNVLALARVLQASPIPPPPED